MNFNLYIFGTPNGFSQYPLDNNSHFFQNIYQKQQTDSQLAIYRSERLVYYSFTRRLAKGISSNYLGVCLIFNGIYCRDSQKIYEFFENSFSDIVLKGEILQIDKVGKISFAIEKISNKQIEIERVKLFFQNGFENNFKKDFAAILPSFKIGNGPKVLSINDTNSDILTAIQQFDCVYISNNEKSNSELDRIHKMLSDLYAEKHVLSTKYAKLLGQKKQYKVVLFLAIAVLGCILGLVLFNKSLISKDGKIHSLENEVTVKKSTITALQSNIEKLQISQLRLNRNIEELNDSVNQKNIIIDEKITAIQSLSYTDSSLNSQNSSLLYEVEDLKSQNERLSSEIASLKYSSSKSYRVIVSKAYCFRQCGGNYYQNDCYYSSDAIIDVFIQRDGYGLTAGGYLKMNELQKN